MKTLYLSAGEAGTAEKAAHIIKNGGLVALPTETVYGLGADGLNPGAVKKIFQAKGRPQDNPLILHICDASGLDDLCHDIPESAWALAAAFWPGPLTMVLPAKAVVPLSTRAGLPTVAVRCPDSDVTREVIRLSGVPIAAPSANISGKPSTTTASHVLHDHDGKIDCIVDGGPCRVGVESTIVDLTETPPRLLRPGGITPEELVSVLGQLTVDKAVTQALSENEVAKAPGMKYKHYAPACTVVIVSGTSQEAAAYVQRHWTPGDRVLCFEEELPLYASCAPLSYGRRDDVATLSAGLFSALRELDDPAIGTVYARCPEGGGMACAVRNRLSKAAAFHIIDPTAENACQSEGRSDEGSDAIPGKYVIGITGGTGCGKTTLLNTIRDLGGLVIDCDAVYHRLLAEDASLLSAIEARFPGTVVDGTLQRKTLGSIVFSDPGALRDLNAITHGAVKGEVERLLAAAPGLAAVDAVALIESGLSKLCHTTVAVTAPTESRVQRLICRDGIPEDYARSRITAQPANAWYAQNCAHTLHNDGTQADFQNKCLAFLQALGIMKA